MNQRFGRWLFWLTWPGLFIILFRTKRTRIAVLVDDTMLVVKPWLGRSRWQSPGGGLHRGEDPVEGALRELQEETGLTLQASDLRYLGSEPHRADGFRFTIELFVARLNSQPPVQFQKGELVAIDWIPMSELTARNTDADTLALLRKIGAHRQV